MKQLSLVPIALCAAALASWPATAQEAAPGQEAQKPQQEQQKKLYDEQAEAKEQIASALAKAKKENRRVLIQWGANWCTWCYAMDDQFKKNKDLSRKILYEYDLIHINMSGDIGEKNKLVAASLGAELRSVPYLTILDADGEAIINQATEPFENTGDLKDGHDPAKLLAFLTEHQAPYLSAESILADGVAKAASGGEGKRVYLHFGAPWCGWCHRLEDWMATPEVAKVFAKHFVDVKIDTDRTIGGGDLLKQMTGGISTGIPWSAVLDEDGKVAAPSFMGEDAKQNIGCPANDEEIEAFIAMLRKGAPAMTDNELAFLADSLHKAKPAGR